MVNDVFIGWLKVTTSVTSAGAGREDLAVDRRADDIRRHVRREERVAVRSERLTAHVRDLVAVGIGPDRDDIRQVDAGREGARRDGPVDCVRVNQRDSGRGDAVDLQLTRSQRRAENRFVKRDNDVGRRLRSAHRLRVWCQ